MPGCPQSGRMNRAVISRLRQVFTSAAVPYGGYLSRKGCRRHLVILSVAVLAACSPGTYGGERSSSVPGPEHDAADAHDAAAAPGAGDPTSPTTPTSASNGTPSPAPTPFMRGPIIIGTSVAGRPLEVFQFGSGPSHRMIVAGIHGGYEGNTIRLADQLIALVPNRPDLVPEETTLYILRSLNPDGEARSDGYKGRVNENLVDLNRNWPALWQAEWPKEGCWTYTYVTAGKHAASEPETRALMNFLLTYEVEAVISYHSAVLGIFPGGQPPDPASVSLAEAVAAVSDYRYPPIDTGCQYTGQLIDWASQAGIAALDIELTNHVDTDLRQNLQVLQTFLAWEAPASDR
jgi:hypothetical protein